MRHISKTKKPQIPQTTKRLRQQTMYQTVNCMFYNKEKGVGGRIDAHRSRIFKLESLDFSTRSMMTKRWRREDINSISVFKLHLFIAYMCARTTFFFSFGNLHVLTAFVCLRRLEDNSVELAFSLHHVGFGTKLRLPGLEASTFSY